MTDAWCRKDVNLKHPVGQCPYDEEPVVTELGRHEDERGVIQDLLAEALTSVTEIYTLAGAVRGNHRHNQTMQWTYVVHGKLLAVTRDGPRGETRTICGPGSLIREPPGVWHAWQAINSTTVLVFTRGPRSGENYEDDVERLAPSNWLLP